MEQEFDKAKVLARVKKMMALANDAAAAPGERNNALRMANATLAKYNLTMAQADMAGAKTEEQRTDGTFTLREYAWMRTVAYNVGELFFCSFFYTKLQNKHAIYSFIGKESNVYTALEMSRYVLHSIDREAQRCARDAGDTPRGNVWRNFCKGAAYEVTVRCRDLIDGNKAEKTPGTALVLANVYQLEADANSSYITDQMGVELRSRETKQRRPGMAGFLEGRDHGSKVGLQNQIGNN